TLDALVSNAALSFAQANALTIAAADAGTGAVTLGSGGVISGGGVVGNTLTVRGGGLAATRAGGLNLTTGNAITTLDARTSNAALSFTQGGALAVAAADAGTGNVTLRTDGALTGGGVVGSTLTVRGSAGGSSAAASLDLTTGNNIGALDALVNNATLSFGQVAGFSVTQANAGTGNVALLSDGAISGTGGVTANTLFLRGAAGGTSRAGSVNLVTGNAITTLDARTNNGALTFGQAGNLSVAQADAGSGAVTLRSDGAISNTGPINTALLTVRGAAGGSTPAESLSLTGVNGIAALDVLVRNNLALVTAGPVSVQQVGSQAGSISITADGSFGVIGGVTAAQNLTLTATSGNIGVLPGGALNVGGDLRLTSAADTVQTGGQISVGGALFITAGQDAIQTGGTTSAGSLGTATQGVSVGRDFLWNGGSVTLPTVYGVSAGRDLGLHATGGSVTVLGNLSAGGSLALETTVGALTLRGITARANGGTLGLQAAGDLGVFSSSLSAPGNMTLRATGTLSSNPSSFTAENISLVSGAALSFSQGTLTAAQNLTAEAGSDLSFQSSVLRASTAPATSNFPVLRLTAGGRLTLRDGSVTADRVEFVAGGLMTNAGSTFRIGTGLLLSARGGVGVVNEAQTTVLALDSGRLPLVIFDTRSGIFLTRLPNLLTPSTTDRPGAEPGQQTWQVPGVNVTSSQLLFGVNDGAPAPPSNAAAGAVVVNLAAGSAPVFMLLNGGTASGNLVAGRLGAYGLPGGATLPNGRALDLTGSLGGVSGESAARFGGLGGRQGTQPDPSALDLYRFNNCVVSSINCVVPTFLQIPTIPLINTVILGLQQPAYDDRDVLLPNVAEKDF
ncbi:MAG: hypothetical protein WCP77_16745, partial [Roseococcus sp.]